MNKNPTYGILQRETGLIDGWYFDKETAEEMRDFYNSEYPRLHHYVITPVDSFLAGPGIVNGMAQEGGAM